MRRIDPFKLAFFRLPLDSDRPANSTRARQQSQDSEPFEDPVEDPLKSWESAWIDLGGEG
jgi:hypothetical protein